MEIEFHGANCLTISSKKTRITIDDNLIELGAKPVTQESDVVVFTHENKKLDQKARLLINCPGEYEIADVSIRGIAVRSHTDENNKKSAILYKLLIDDIRIVVTGHIFPELSENDLESIGVVDILCVPVGGNGYTLDGIGALKIIKEIEPKIIVPTHYQDKAIRYPVPQQPLENALKDLAMEPKETVPKLKLKATDLVDIAQLIVISRS